MPQNPEVVVQHEQTGAWRRWTAAAVAVVGIAGGIGYLTGGESNDSVATGANTEQGVDTSAAGEATEVCPDTWAMPGLPLNDKHRILVDGMPELGNATNESEARAALAKWADVISTDNDVLAAYAGEITGENFDEAAMVDANGCATDEAERARFAMEATIGASDVADGSGLVPAYLTNTGVDSSGRVVMDDEPGITGDRQGIVFITKDGRVLAALKRCANFASEKVNLPYGTTDNQPTTTTTIKVTPKHDDGRLPGNPNVPADQDKGTPDKPGKGPAGQQPASDGYVPGETRPSAPATTVVESSPSTTEGRGPATTNPRPSGPATTVVATTVVATSTPNTAPLPPLPTAP